MYQTGVTLPPPGEYAGSISATAMQAVATTTEQLVRISFLISQTDLPLYSLTTTVLVGGVAQW